MEEDSDRGAWIASTDGIFRLKKDQLQKIADGVAAAGITKIASDVFLATIGKSRTELLSDPRTIRLSKQKGGWRSDTLIDSIPQVRFRLDHSGRVLYGCTGGFCELSAEAITLWQPGTDLKVARHRLDTRMNYAGPNLSFFGTQPAACGCGTRLMQPINVQETHALRRSPLRVRARPILRYSSSTTELSSSRLMPSSCLAVRECSEKSRENKDIPAQPRLSYTGREAFG